MLNAAAENYLETGAASVSFTDHVYKFCQSMNDKVCIESEHTAMGSFPKSFAERSKTIRADVKSLNGRHSQPPEPEKISKIMAEVGDMYANMLLAFQTYHVTLTEDKKKELNQEMDAIALSADALIQSLDSDYIAIADRSHINHDPDHRVTMFKSYIGHALTCLNWIMEDFHEKSVHLDPKKSYNLLSLFEKERESIRTACEYVTEDNYKTDAPAVLSQVRNMYQNLLQAQSVYDYPIAISKRTMAEQNINQAARQMNELLGIKTGRGIAEAN